MRSRTMTRHAGGLAALAALLLALPAAAEKAAEPAPDVVQAPLSLPALGDTAAALSAVTTPSAGEPASSAPVPVTPTVIEPQQAEKPTQEAAPAAPPPAEDPILLVTRERLAQPAPRLAAQERADRQALVAFYAERKDGPLWVGPSGLTKGGLAVIGEIAKADDWGLAASAFELPDLRSAGIATPQQRADEEIAISMAVLKYARHARGGRLDPTQLSRHWDMKPPVLPASTVIGAIAAARAPDAYLRGLHPQHAQFERLRAALVEARSGKPEAAHKPTEPNPAVRVPDGPALKPGQKHDSVVALRQRLGVPAEKVGDNDLYDARLAEAVRSFQQAQGSKQTGVLDKATRTALNAGAKPTGANRAQQLIANMERWRWLPEDMGEFHVWDNIPEFQARVFNKGQQVHQARIIVGKPETPTPVFSADMRYVVFHPGWGVPDSIKVKELLPYLRRTSGFFGGESDTTVLRKHNLVVSYNGRPVDASSVDWQQTDIRRYQFVQPPGASNVLGTLKFRFPNKHDVYMHDTSQRDLFNQTRRTYSHGCVRVDNPRRLAELLLERDRGMPASEVGRLLVSGPKDNQIELKAKIPVHITYFTAVAEADGTIKTHTDIYGHDARVTAALNGRPMAIEPSPDLTVASRAPQRQVRPAKQAQSFDFFSGLFGN